MAIFCHTGLQFDLIPTHWCDSLHCRKEIGENAARNRKKVFFYFRDNRTENNGCIKFCLLSKNTSSHCLTGNQNSNHQSIGKYLKISFPKSICISLPATLTIYQKWVYSKAAPIADQNGSDTAFGGRKGKSAMSPLLIIKLIQDHAVWTKEQLIFNNT